MADDGRQPEMAGPAEIPHETDRDAADENKDIPEEAKRNVGRLPDASEEFDVGGLAFFGCRRVLGKLWQEVEQRALRLRELRRSVFVQQLLEQESARGVELFDLAGRDVKMPVAQLARDIIDVVLKLAGVLDGPFAFEDKEGFILRRRYGDEFAMLTIGLCHLKSRDPA